LEVNAFAPFPQAVSHADLQQPNPLAIATLKITGINTTGLRSKSWDEFAT